MALYNVEARDINTRRLLDWAANLTRDEALEVVEEFEQAYQDDPVEVEMIRRDL